MNLKVVVRRVQRRLDALNLDAANVSRAASPTRSPDVIRNWQRRIEKEKDPGATMKTVEPVARELGVPVAWLGGDGPEDYDEFLAEQERNSNAIPVAGYTGRVGAGGSAINVEQDPNEAERRIPVIAGSAQPMKIAELDGQSLGVQFDRWFVVYGQPVKFKPEFPYGKLCLVLTIDDEMTVKWVERTRKRGVKLLDAAGEPYRDGIELQWAAPVLGMRPK